MERKYPIIQRGVCAAGLTALALLFLFWLGDGNGRTWQEFFSAFLCLLLFAALCLRFVPQWFSLWFGPEMPAMEGKGLPAALIFSAGVFCAAIHLALVWGVLYYVNRELTAGQFLDFWRSADAYHYLCIARDWYIQEGDLDRVVQLVFLPGYPLAVRAVHFLTGDYILAGLFVSILSFAGALCIVYRLVMIDHVERTALLTVVFLCLTPGAFFFAAPMSESFFLLLSASCLYCARRNRWLVAGVFGALASFTRSMGLMLFVPLFMEMATGILHGRKSAWRGIAALFLIPLGFGGYCLINYLVSGNPFQFMKYQSTHWHQNLGLFFNTAAYQMRYAITAQTETLLGLWLPNLTAVFASLAVLTAGAKRMRASYTLWAIFYYAVAIGATWLLSAPRYLAVLLPVQLSLALRCDEKRSRTGMIAAILALCELYYLIMFALRFSVW